MSKIAAAKTAYEVLQQPDLVIWDTETTGLDGAMIITLGAVDRDGNTLLDLRINPQTEIEEGASNIHGIRNIDLVGCPTWPEVYPAVVDALGNRPWAIYNANFDGARLVTSLDCYALSYQPFKRTRDELYCVMLGFAEFYGDWHDYYNNYRWQRLSFAAEHCGLGEFEAHSALADAIAALGVLRYMADWYEIYLRFGGERD